jgi:hypothetical protein
MNDRTPPHDDAAEQAAIGMGLNLGRLPDELSTLRPKDFYQPDHAVIWAVMLWLLAQGRACDGNAVLARLMETRQTRAVSLLPDLVTGLWASSAENLALIILDRAGRRHVIEATTRTLQAAYESEDPYETILQRAEAELRKVPAKDTGSVESLQTLDEFLGEHVPEPEWVLPGLLAHGERLIITGTEGLGKSTLCRQVGLCAAAGMDPFTGVSVPPQTVLIIDAENPMYIMQKRYGELRRAINAHGRNIDATRLWIDRRPGGLNVSDPGDRRWLQRRVNLVNPDLLVIGPAYKLHHAENDDKDETIARTVTSVLDDLRGTAALLLEHHAGNEQGGGQRPIRPFGSSLWRRWPEFGYGIRPAKPPPGMDPQTAKDRRLVDFADWRGPRDERSWPQQMESGGTGLPWIETVVDYRRSA